MGKFVIGSSAEGYRFLIETFKGEILGISSFYESEDETVEAIKRMKKVVPSAKIYDETNDKIARRGEARFVIREDLNKMYRFSFVEGKDEVRFTSPAYTSFDFCVKNASSVKAIIKGA